MLLPRALVTVYASMSMPIDQSSKELCLTYPRLADFEAASRRRLQDSENCDEVTNIGIVVIRLKSCKWDISE